MRDRRNTSLSISSTASTSSTVSGTSRSSLNEKRHSSPPPPSSTLPAPVTEPHRPRHLWRRSMVVRTIGIVCILLLLWRCLRGWPLRWPRRGGLSTFEQELVGGGALPVEPTVQLVAHQSGQKWTVAIPHNTSFPLHGTVYKDLCTHGDALGRRLTGKTRSFRLKDWRRRGSYYAQDPSFVDIADAEQSGALPQPALQEAVTQPVCSSSLTFAMDADETGFGKTLLLLWLSYGLAKREGRAFFIDDSRWVYGKYTSYFVPPPSQDCLPPAPHHVLPCPHQARHLVVSADTVPWNFGMHFHEEFIYQRRYGSEKYQQIYDLARTGYEDLFELVGEDAIYARSRTANMKEDAASHGGSVVGMQIRRGDQHPFEYQFSRDYLPLERYATAARSLFRSFLSRPGPGHANDDLADFSALVEYVHSPLVLASDDPEVFVAPELSQAAAPFTVQKAQERIVLATKAALDRTSPVAPIRAPGSAYVKHVDENSGWEGGFYKALFHSLGYPKTTSGSGTLERLSSLSNIGIGDDSTATEQAMRMRELVGRAYLLDLAVLSQSDGVVCAVSSAACRILGVMLGWDAVVNDRWMNVDDSRPWSWDGSQ